MCFRILCIISLLWGVLGSEEMSTHTIAPKEYTLEPSYILSHTQILSTSLFPQIPKSFPIASFPQQGFSFKMRAYEVAAIFKRNGFVLHTPQGDVAARFVLNAAGVDADRVHEMLEPNDWETLPSRGEYYLLDKSEHDRVSRVIFQCPGPEGKGVLVAPTIHGNLICGPNAQGVEDRLDLGNTADGMAEVRAKAARSVPGVEWRQNIRNFAGLRANTTRSDFIIEESKAYPGFIDLAGIKSPGLSSAPAIAKMAAEMLKADGLALEPDPDFVDKREHIVFKELSAEEKNELIRRDPRYGRVVCRCETITEGEIVAALHSPIPPRSINGVKRRCNAGMGRCQGGFCGPRVQEIIARELGIDQAEVLLEQAGSTILTGRTKTGGNTNV